MIYLFDSNSFRSIFTELLRTTQFWYSYLGKNSFVIVGVFPFDFMEMKKWH